MNRRWNVGHVELFLFGSKLEADNPYARTIFIGPVGEKPGRRPGERIHMLGRSWWSSWFPSNGVAINVGRTYVAVIAFRRSRPPRMS